MEVVVSEVILASRQTVEEAMREQVKQMCYRYCGSGVAYDPNCYEHKTWEEGRLWWRKTYNEWKYKGVFQYSIQENSVGDFTLTIFMPSDESLPAVKTFLEGVEERLKNVHNKIAVIYVRRPLCDDVVTDKPSIYYYY